MVVFCSLDDVLGSELRCAFRTIRYFARFLRRVGAGTQNMGYFEIRVFFSRCFFLFLGCFEFLGSYVLK